MSSKEKCLTLGDIMKPCRHSNSKGLLASLGASGSFNGTSDNRSEGRSIADLINYMPHYDATIWIHSLQALFCSSCLVTQEKMQGFSLRTESLKLMIRKKNDLNFLRSATILGDRVDSNANARRFWQQVE